MFCLYNIFFGSEVAAVCAKSIKFAEKILTMKKKILITAAAAVFVMLIAAVCLAPMQHYDSADVRIYIPAGSTADAVGDSLRSALGEAYGGEVYRCWLMLGGEAATAHGSYVVKSGAWSLRVARMVQSGRQTPVRVHVSAARLMGDVYARLASKLEADSASIARAIDSVARQSGFTDKRWLPAAILPDTYEFYWTAKPERVAQTLLKVRNDFWTEQRRAQAAALGLTPVQVATVASIVEEESAMADEYPVIARLYLNRLAKGMPLQADPTVKYAVGDFTLRRITGRHLAVESPYNTYKHEGLPPGPIRMTERRTIDAVLTAPAHTYLYMCAKEDFSGRHNFATTFAEHQANARRYQQELNRRGIH